VKKDEVTISILKVTVVTLGVPKTLNLTVKIKTKSSRQDNRQRIGGAGLGAGALGDSGMTRRREGDRAGFTDYKLGFPGWRDMID